MLANTRPKTIFVTLGLVLASGAGLRIEAASREVLEVPDADAVIIEMYQLPIRLGLANIEVPSHDRIRKACHGRLKELVGGKDVEVIYKPEFGVDRHGTGLVHLTLDRQNVAAVLIGEGLAKYVPAEGRSPYDRMLSLAQDQAKGDEAGLWGLAEGETTQEPVIAAADSAAPAVPEEPDSPAVDAGTTARGPIVSELNGRYYYDANDPRVADINPQRRIYYPDAGAARKAGKREAPERVVVADAGIDEAEQLYRAGRELYQQAIAAGNTTQRDDLYGQAFVKLTQAMQVFTRLVEAHPDNSALGERLREIRQLRYGAMKQRRF